jgi:DnaJ-domain-containing protein 1
MRHNKPKRGFCDGYKTYDTSKGFGNAQAWKSAFYERMTGEEATKIIQDEAEDDDGSEQLFQRRGANPFELAKIAAKILGVNVTDSKDIIRSAFKKLISEWHEDKHPDNLEQAKKMSQKLIAAYTLLT